MIHLSKLQKLRRMSGDEVRCRISRVASRHREKRRWRRPKGIGVSEQFTEPQDLLKRCVELVPGTSEDQIESLRNEYPSLWSEFQQRAERRAGNILRGRWTLLGHPYDLTGEIDWHSDPRTGYQWPREFYGDLPLYDLPGETDIKYPWELSRHQFLCELGRNYQFNGCERSAARVQEILVDWVDQNPVYEGVNWTSALEVAMRSISWIWTLASLASWDGWRDRDLERVMTSLWGHGIYLAENFSYYTSPYNHLVGEAAGLISIAAVFDEDVTTRKWHHQAHQVLASAGAEQFYEDRFSVEQATGYHYFTLGFLAWASTACHAVGKPLLELTPIIHEAFRTGASFRRPDGLWPALGDLDSARSIPVFPTRPWSFDSLNHLAAVLFDDPELIVDSDSPGEELFWLQGIGGLSRWQQMPAEFPTAIRCSHGDSGYVVASDGEDWMLFDAGPIAAGVFADATPSTAHGHADMLQVLYYSAGQSVLDDSGMPYYGGDSDWVAYFRGPAAHNTLQIDGAEFVRHAGRLAWSHQTERPRLEANLTGSHWLCGAQVMWPGVTLQRQLCCIPGQGLWVADRITTDQPRRVRWCWQLPNSPVSLSGNIASWGDFELSHSATKGKGVWTVMEASDLGPEGWRCFGYGERSAGKRLRIEHWVHDSLLVLTSVGRESRPPLSVEFDGCRIEQAGYFSAGGEQILGLSDCRWYLPAPASRLAVQ